MVARGAGRMDEATLSEFRRGTFSVPEAVSLLTALTSSVARATIKKRLESGLILAKAEEIVVWLGSQQKERHALTDIDPSYWLLAELPSYDPFWQTGEVTFKRREGRAYSDTLIEAFGVRLIDSGVTRLMASLSISLPDAQASDTSEDNGDARPDVSLADLRRWAEVFVGVYGDRVTEALALRSAKAMFPDSAVSRQRVRELLPSRKPGRPVSRGKNRE